jgi:S-adenosylmethionine-diacylglycerol 3-amino-3-carboxypropyl transferase
MTLGDHLSQRLFSFVHGRNLIYNACWEDPRLDHRALQIGPNDTVLLITSAGCNALDYALAGPQHVYAVDVNPRQNALLELKIAGIRALRFDEFFAVFGHGRYEDFPAAYRSRLRPQLSIASREFWDRRLNFFTGADRPSFYFHGTSGMFAWLINLYLDGVARVRSAINEMLAAPSIQDQERIYRREIAHALWRRPLRWTLRRDSTMSLLGVPRPQKQQIDREYAGGTAQFVQDRIDHVFGRTSLRDNYFWRVYLTGRYARDCCPRYLTPECFAALRGGLVDRISVHTCSVADFLERHDARISRFVLLDHQDWLSHFAGGRELTREWQAIVRRADDPCRLIWRSAGLGSEFIDRVEVMVGGRRQRIGERLRYDRVLAEELHAHDRVHTYGSFHIADLAV